MLETEERTIIFIYLPTEPFEVLVMFKMRLEIVHVPYVGN